jgi:hypothetical protein
MKFLFLLLFSLHTYAALPPTATLGSGDATRATTFNFLFPYTEISHAGVNATFGKTFVPGGGTGRATLTQNGILYGNAASPIGQTAAGATGTVLKGNTGAAPSFGAITLSGDVTGVLPLANGGTNAAMTASHGGVLYSTASAISIGSVGTSGQILHSSGAGAPTWSAVDLASATEVTGILPNANTTGTPNATGSTLVLRNASGDFSTVMITANMISQPYTTSTVGQIMSNGNRVFHTFGQPGNVFVGRNAGNFTASSTTATCLGYECMQGLTSAVGPVAIGYQAGKALTSSQASVLIGYLAGTAITSGADNVAIGNQALKTNQTAAGNIGVGFSALANSTTGANNVAIGYTTQNANTTGAGNVSVGTTTMTSNMSGDNNVALGSTALRDVRGTGNIGIGYFAGVTGTAISFDISSTYIGYQSGKNTSSNLNQAMALGANSIVGASFSIVIGTSLDKTSVGGIAIPTSVLTVNGPVQVSGDATSCSSTIGGAIRYTSNNFDGCNATAWSRIIATTSTPASGDTLVYDGSRWYASNTTSGTDRIVRAVITQTAGTYSITSQNGSWLSSITKNATADTTLNIAGSTFSAAPTCVVTGIESLNLGYLTAVPSTSAIRINSYTTGGAAAQESSYHIICMGPR